MQPAVKLQFCEKKQLHDAAVTIQKFERGHKVRTTDAPRKKIQKN